MYKFKVRSAILLTIVIIGIVVRLNEPRVTANVAQIKPPKQFIIVLPQKTLSEERLHKVFSITSKMRSPKTVSQASLPVIGKDWIEVEISAYNAGDTSQCWGDPCISTDGTNICEGLASGKKYVATRLVPLGSIIEIEGYGQCEVVDLVSTDYQHRIDMAFPKEQKKAAIVFGIQRLKVRLISKS